MATNSTSAPDNTLVSVYYKLVLFSCILVVILSIITIVGNGLLLIVTWKDPFKSFTTPSSSFVLSLGVANLLIGVILEPMIFCQKLMMYLKQNQVTKHTPFKVVSEVSLVLSTVTMNASFLTVLVLTWCQVVAVAWPYKYKTGLTSFKSRVCVFLIWCYVVAFAFLPVMGVSDAMTHELDLYVNTTLVIVALLLGYVVLYIAYRAHQKSQSTWQSQASEARCTRQRQRRASERASNRNFTVLILLLAGFVILFSSPITVNGYLKIYWLPTNGKYQTHYAIASLLCNDIILFKFALDPVAYALRLPKYRMAFRSILRRQSNEQGVELNSYSRRPSNGSALRKD